MLGNILLPPVSQWSIC